MFVWSVIARLSCPNSILVWGLYSCEIFFSALVVHIFSGQVTEHLIWVCRAMSMRQRAIITLSKTVHLIFEGFSLNPGRGYGIHSFLIHQVFDVTERQEGTTRGFRILIWGGVELHPTTNQGRHRHSCGSKTLEFKSSTPEGGRSIPNPKVAHKTPNYTCVCNSC